MRKIIVGIDISKEKLNVCLLEGVNIVHEDEIENTVTSLHKWFGQMRKSLRCRMDEVLLCAEFTGRYIYPLTVACHEEEAFLWIAEYAFRHLDKAVAYKLPDKELASIRILMSSRELILSDRKKYEAQIRDQRRFMSKEDYAMQAKIWKSIVRELQRRLYDVDKRVDELVAANERASHQVELLKSVDGVGQRIAVAMVVCTDCFTRFENARQFNCYAGMAPFTYTSGKSIYSKAKVSQRANKHMKALLHLAAVCVATHMKSGEYKEYYDRRIAEGKHPMCVLNIIRAKLVSRMFAVIKRDEKYSRDYTRKYLEKNLATPLQFS